MYRNISEKIYEIMRSGSEHPLLLTGAKGTGKTYSILEAAKRLKKEIRVIDFENDAEARFFFNDYYNGLKEVLGMSDHAEIPIIYNALASFFELDMSLLSRFTIILDEIGYCEGAEALLSLGGESNLLLTASTGIPDSEAFTELKMHPMTFDEFLIATDHKWYAEVIQAHFDNQRHVPDIIHNDLLDLFDIYLETGGMPAVVNDYLQNENMYSIKSRQKELLRTFRYFPEELFDCGEALRIRQILDLTGIPKDHKREHKFKFTNLRKGATQGIYGSALEFLIRSDILHVNYRGGMEEDEKAPAEEQNSAVLDYSSFRLFYTDTGLLNASFQNSGDIRNFDSEEKRYLLLENCLMQHLFANSRIFHYWESQAQARIDFVVLENGVYIPIEIKTEEQKKKKSLSIYMKKYQPDYAYRLSSDNFETKDGIRNIPYYAMFCL